MREKVTRKNVGAGDVERCHFLVAHRDAFCIGVGVSSQCTFRPVLVAAISWTMAWQF